MRIAKTFFAAAAILAATLLQASLASAQTAAALSGAVRSAKEGMMEGVVVSAKKDGSTITVSVVSDEQGPLQLPGVATRSRALRDRHPRRWLRSRWSQGRHPHGRPGDQARRQAQADAKPRRPDDECRVAHKHAGHRRPKEIRAPMQRLPHASNASCARPTTPTNSCRCSSAWAAIIRAARRSSRSGSPATPGAISARGRKRKKSRSGLPAST